MKNKIFVLITILFITQGIIAQTILGIDVSHHQGSINWNLVANDGKVFAYCKATEGMTYQDPNFTTYMTNGTAAGVVMGAYHFARPDNNSATQDANNFITHAQNYIGNGYLPPVLDLEDPNSSTHLDQIYTSSQLTNWVQTWLSTVETQTGVRPIIYTNSNYANFLQSSVNTYGLWIAKPGTSPTTPPTNIGIWNDWVFKQYSWYGSVNGISGNVDLDVFHGSVSDFNDLTGTSSISNIDNNDIKIFPNPVSDFLHIQNKGKSILKAGIYDINGRLLQNVNSNTENIPVENLQKGIYFLQLQLDNGQNGVIKFIKK